MRLIRDIIMDRRSAKRSQDIGSSSERGARSPLVQEAFDESVGSRTGGNQQPGSGSESFGIGASANMFSNSGADRFAAGKDADPWNASAAFDEVALMDLASQDTLAQEPDSDETFDADEDLYEEDEFDGDTSLSFEDEGDDLPSEEAIDDEDPDSISNADAYTALNRMPDPFEKLYSARIEDNAPLRSPSPLRAFRTSAPQPEATTNELPRDNVAAAEFSVEELIPLADMSDLGAVDIPAPVPGRGSARSGRVKTRLLGFSAGALGSADPFESKESRSDGSFPVGWLVVVSELGRGTSYALHDGVSKVGRGQDQTVSLNFGDNSISRENHVSIAYDAEQNKFFIGHSGKSNLVRLNRTPLLSTEQLRSRDLIRLGETTLRFIALCEGDFSWNITDEEARKHA